MKTTIRFTPKKLDRLADEQFAIANNIQSNTVLERDPSAAAHTLAGIALRRWAVSLRAARTREKRRKIAARAARRATYA
jgi:hypothetical protein